MPHVANPYGRHSPHPFPLWPELPRITLPQLAILRLMPLGQAQAKHDRFTNRIDALVEHGLIVAHAGPKPTWQLTDRGRGTLLALARYRSQHYPRDHTQPRPAPKAKR